MNVNVGTKERVASTLGGGALLSWAARRRSPLAIPVALGAAALVWRGLSGHCPVNTALGRGANGKHAAEAPSPGKAGKVDSGRVDGGGKTPPTLPVERPARRRKDPVQEASEESFPASDPPSWTPASL